MKLSVLLLGAVLLLPLAVWAEAWTKVDTCTYVDKANRITLNTCLDDPDKYDRVIRERMTNNDCLATMEAALRASEPFVENWKVNENSEAYFKFNSTFMADYHKASKLLAEAKRCARHQ